MTKRKSPSSSSSAAAASESSDAVLPPPSKIARSLDESENTAPLAATASDLPPLAEVKHWKIIEPVESAEIEIVQEDIQAGIKLSKVDITRMKSSFFNSMLEDAEKVGSKRILVGRATFSTPAQLHEVLFRQVVPTADDYVVTTPEVIQILHACLKLDLMHSAFTINTKNYMVSETGKLSAIERITLGTTFQLPEMKKSGILRLAAESKVKIPAHLVETCANAWRPLANEAEQIRAAVDALLKTRDKPLTFGSKFTSYSYRGDANDTITQITRILGLPL